MKINYNKQVNFTGRNGYFKQTGLDIMELSHSNTIMLAPITSQGKIGRCDIEIPKENIPALIKYLKTIK